MNPTLKRLALIPLLLSLSASAALAQSRAPDSEPSVRPYYKWEVPLDRETKAVVGPIDAERVVKLRLDRPDSDAAMNFPDETIQICMDRYCETLELAPGGEQTGRAPELDFTSHITAVPGDYRKTYLTIQRKNHATNASISLSIKVETDHTAELPQFTVLSDVQPHALESSARQHSVEHDGMDIKAVDVTLPSVTETLETKALAQ